MQTFSLLRKSDLLSVSQRPRFAREIECDAHCIYGGPVTGTVVARLTMRCGAKMRVIYVTSQRCKHSIM